MTHSVDNEASDPEFGKTVAPHGLDLVKAGPYRQMRARIDVEFRMRGRRDSLRVVSNNARMEA